MRNLQKMKRISISDVRMAFPEIGKAEQALYVGMWKYTYDPNNANNPWAIVDDGKPNATVCVSGKSGELTIFNDYDFQQLRGGNQVKEFSARPFFEFMNSKTDFEWSLVKEKGGDKWMVKTDRDNGYVNLSVNGNIEEICHSHNKGISPSQNDMDIVEEAKKKGYNVKWTIHYKGEYRDYDENGSYGNIYSFGYNF